MQTNAGTAWNVKDVERNLLYPFAACSDQRPQYCSTEISREFADEFVGIEPGTDY